MRQTSPACLLSQPSVRHRTVPMQTWSWSTSVGHSMLNGLHTTSSRQLPVQIALALSGAPTLEVHEKVGQTPEVKQQPWKQLPLASQGTLGWPACEHITCD